MQFHQMHFHFEKEYAILKADGRDPENPERSKSNEIYVYRKKDGRI